MACGLNKYDEKHRKHFCSTCKNGSDVGITVCINICKGVGKCAWEELKEEKNIEEIVTDTVLETIDLLERAIDKIQTLRIEREDEFYEYCDSIGTDDDFVDDTVNDTQFVIDNLTDGVLSKIRNTIEEI